MYTVTNNKTRETFDFEDPKEALDYGEKFNGIRMAHIVDIYDDRREDLGEMKYEILYDKHRTIDLSVKKCTVYQIKALRDFSSQGGIKIKAGELGGYVGGYSNLSHQGGCWISENAAVLENGFVCGEARVKGEAKVYGRGQVYDSALVKDTASVYGFGSVEGHATAAGYTQIYGNGRICDRAYLIDTTNGTYTIGGGSIIECPGGLHRTPLYIENICGGERLTAYFNSLDLKLNVYFKNRTFKSITEFKTFVEREFSQTPFYDQAKTIVELLNCIQQ